MVRVHNTLLLIVAALLLAGCFRQGTEPSDTIVVTNENVAPVTLTSANTDTSAQTESTTDDPPPVTVLDVTNEPIQRTRPPTNTTQSNDEAPAVTVLSETTSDDESDSPPTILPTEPSGIVYITPEQPRQVELPSATPLPTATPTLTPLPTATPTATRTPIVNEQGEIVTPTDIPQEVIDECTHVIRGGDTLFDIAIRNGTTVGAINELNDLSIGAVLSIGQRLLLPGCLEEFGVQLFELTEDAPPPVDNSPDTIVGTSAPQQPGQSADGNPQIIVSTPEPEILESQTPTITPTPFEGVLHVVAAGELLGAIAAQYGVSVEDIVSANNLRDPDSLAIGQELVIPGVSEPDNTDE